MKQFDQWYFPSHETHMPEWMLKKNQRIEGRLTYQYHKYEAAIKFCRNRRVSVDAGAHIGLMSFWMARDFEKVKAFEPIAEHRECFGINLAARESVKGGAFVQIYPYALGATEGMVSLTIPHGSSGGTHISGAGDIEMKTLDSFELQNVDFLKIDVEGSELAIVQGGVETIKRCRPCVMVEQKQHIMKANFGTSGAPAVDFLRSLGAVLRKEMGGDYIMSWD